MKTLKLNQNFYNSNVSDPSKNMRVYTRFLITFWQRSMLFKFFETKTIHKCVWSWSLNGNDFWNSRIGQNEQNSKDFNGFLHLLGEKNILMSYFWIQFVPSKQKFCKSFEKSTFLSWFSINWRKFKLFSPPNIICRQSFQRHSFNLHNFCYFYTQWDF